MSSVFQHPLDLRLDHLAVVVPELAPLNDFLCNVAGLSAGPRPSFRTPGRWLYAERAPVVHLIQAPREVPTVPRVTHFALRVGSAAHWLELTRRLQASRIPFALGDIESGEERQLFVQLSSCLQIEFVTSIAPIA